MTTLTYRTLTGEWGAVYSPCETYRYRLWRQWDGLRPTLAFCLLNPSTATELKNDPTIERCQRRAVEWGYGRLEIVNIFALRSTNPMALYSEPDPIGWANDSNILSVARHADRFVCGWGKHGALRRRGEYVHSLLLEHFPDGNIQVLALNKDGSPKHPLYVGYATQPKEWK